MSETPAQNPDLAVPPPDRPISGSNVRLALVFIAVISGVTTIAWGAGKVACNLHPPGYQAFKPAGLEKLASTPKDAALEFHHRLAVYDFQGARELLAGDDALVATAEKACDAACLGARDARLESVLTRAILLSRNGETATVNAESHVSGEVNAASYELKRDGKIWKIVKQLD